MIVVDSSALIAIALDETGRDRLVDVMDRADRLAISAGTLIEARMVAFNKGGARLVERLDRLVSTFDMEIVPPDLEQADAAHEAFVAYGKGTGHPARLNFGDLFGYALARTRGVPLLFKGEDFARTDIVSASGD